MDCILTASPGRGSGGRAIGGHRFAVFGFGSTKMINRPWWLPEGLETVGIQAWDAASNCWFTSNSKQSSFKHMEGPIFIWDRVLTNEETMTAREAIARHDMETILAMKPAHVGSGHDVDENGVCHCVICQDRKHNCR